MNFQMLLRLIKSPTVRSVQTQFLSVFIQHINGLESGFDKLLLIYTLEFFWLILLSQVNSFENVSKYWLDIPKVFFFFFALSDIWTQ